MPSKDFHRNIEQCKIVHATRKVFSGNGILKHREALVRFAEEIDARSAIDFGCGNSRPEAKTDGQTLTADFVKIAQGEGRTELHFRNARPSAVQW